MRHLSFWIVALFGLDLLGVGVRPLFNVKLHQNMLVENILQPVLYLPGELFLVYTLLYFVIPRYVLTTRYKSAFLWTIALCLAGGFIAALSFILLDNALMAPLMKRPPEFLQRTAIDGQWNVLYKRLPFEFLFSLRSVVNVAAFAAALKLLKYWYENQYLNSILQKEKLDAELQSLKAQLHPHFLFNTLNNIYSITQNTSSQASDMLLRLSGLLRYILYDCNLPFVRLSQEFKLIENYIALETIRYKNLDLTVNLPAETNGYVIAPLLLLPLVENCFKHGTSRVIEQPWIRIDGVLKGNTMLIKLINGKKFNEELTNFAEGIGLQNVKKRLDLLYEGRHELSILSEQDVFVVNFKIELTSNQ